jgi:hypothetical protein
MVLWHRVMSLLYCRYSLMCRCWEFKAVDRPHFSEIIPVLEMLMHRQHGTIHTSLFAPVHSSVSFFHTNLSLNLFLMLTQLHTILFSCTCIADQHVKHTTPGTLNINRSYYNEELDHMESPASLAGIISPSRVMSPTIDDDAETSLWLACFHVLCVEFGCILSNGVHRPHHPWSFVCLETCRCGKLYMWSLWVQDSDHKVC